MSITAKLTTYIVTIGNSCMGQRWEVTAESWVEACAIALDDDRVSYVERINPQSSIYACYRRFDGNTKTLVGNVCHIRTVK
jgi:hypothetical protein